MNLAIKTALNAPLGHAASNNNKVYKSCMRKTMFIKNCTDSS